MYRELNYSVILSVLYLLSGSAGLLMASPLSVGGAWGSLDDTNSLSADFSNRLMVGNYSKFTNLTTLSQEESGLKINYMKPALGSFVLDARIFPDESAVEQSALNQGGGRAQIYNSYFTSFFGGRFGVFSGFIDEQNPFSLSIMSSRRFGASLNYAGFYLSVTDKVTEIEGSTDDFRAEKAASAVSLGYGSNAFDVRVTYLESEFSDGQPTDLEGKQWMIGGLLKLTPKILINANAFFVNRDAQNLFPEESGKGARFGVTLQF